MSNPNITHVTHTTDLFILIGSLDSQHGESGHHPANIGSSFLRYMYNDLHNHKPRDTIRENRLGKTKKSYITDILEAAQPKEGIKKNDKNLGRMR